MDLEKKHRVLNNIKDMLEKELGIKTRTVECERGQGTILFFTDEDETVGGYLCIKNAKK